MLEELNNDDWREAFKYAEGHTCELQHRHDPVRAETLFGAQDLPPATFTREDAAKIIALREGENDEYNWLGIFELECGEYAYLSAGCDYTGWG